MCWAKTMHGPSIRDGQGTDQWTMGIDTQMAQQDLIREANGNHVCVRMENTGFTIRFTANDFPSSSTTSAWAPKHFHKTTGNNYAKSTLSNHSFGGAGMTTLVELHKHLRIWECQLDIRQKIRIQWLEEAHQPISIPSFPLQTKEAICRIIQSGTECKYQAFYKINPLVHMAL